MNALAIVYFVLTVALTAVAIYVQVTSTNLSLPLPTGTTVLTILLPLIAAANFVYTPRLQSYLQHRFASYSLPRELLIPLIQILQGVLTVVVATISAESFVPGETLDCRLQNNWQHLWSAHDGRAIERVQDTFNCCGLRTIKHEAWPSGQCSEMYKRHTACMEPWRASMQRTSGLGFAVAALVGIIQLIQLVRYRLRGSGLMRGNSAMRHRGLPQSAGEDQGQSQGLLEEGNADSDDEEQAQDGDGRKPDSFNNRAYGAFEGGEQSPRMEPSGLGNDRPRW